MTCCPGPLTTQALSLLVVPVLWTVPRLLAIQLAVPVAILEGKQSQVLPHCGIWCQCTKSLAPALCQMQISGACLAVLIITCLGCPLRMRVA
jgi:hypothetical protein